MVNSGCSRRLPPSPHPPWESRSCWEGFGSRIGKLGVSEGFPPAAEPPPDEVAVGRVPLGFNFCLWVSAFKLGGSGNWGGEFGSLAGKIAALRPGGSEGMLLGFSDAGFLVGFAAPASGGSTVIEGGNLAETFPEFSVRAALLSTGGPDGGAPPGRMGREVGSPAGAVAEVTGSSSFLEALPPAVYRLDQY